MKMNAMICASIVGAAVLLGGCSTSTSSTPTSSQSNTNTVTSPTAATTSTPQSADANTTKPTTVTQPSPTSTVNQNTSTATSNQQQITQIMKMAYSGQVPNIPFPSDTTNFGDVQNKWGKPDQQNQAGAGIYATYTARGVAFGFNKGEQIFDVRSYNPQLQQITMSQVVKALGKPGDTRYNGNETILMYPAGPRFQLLWIFTKATSANPDPHVDHVSVFCPQDTVNSMAQTAPRPTIVLNQAPGTVGSLFTFSILQSSPSYALSELEWMGTNGQSVVNTYHQAVNNGATGGLVPSFQISGDRQTMSFDYPASMVGQAGKLVAIFQNTNGQAIIGESASITLK